MNIDNIKSFVEDKITSDQGMLYVQAMLLLEGQEVKEEDELRELFEDGEDL